MSHLDDNNVLRTNGEWNAERTQLFDLILQNGAVEVIDIDTDTNNDEEVAVTAADNGKVGKKMCIINKTDKNELDIDKLVGNSKIKV